MAACLLPKYLAHDVYGIDLPVVVFKYIGETERNLARASDRYRHTRLRFFLDEADAIFGNRSEARDGQDRYANLEATQLL
jgi:SpoVK/Ycf46/Vps4 family AAA+-type ATPase